MKYESPYLDGGTQAVYDGGGGVSYEPPSSSPPPPPPPIEESLGDFFALPYTSSGVEVETTNNSDSPTPLTGPDSPFATFADLVRGTLGGGGAVREPQAPTLVPVPTSSGGIGAGALLLVLALIGGAVWWFFIRKKKGASDAG